MIKDLTKLLITQYELDKENGQAEYLKISVQDFYKGLIKFLKEIGYE